MTHPVRARATIDREPVEDLLLAESEPLAALAALDAPRTWESALESVAASARSVASRLNWTALWASGLLGLVSLQLAASAGTHLVVSLFASVTVSVCAGVAWQSAGRHRVGWASISIGLLFWCAGAQARPLWQAVEWARPVAPSLRDLAALGSAVLLCVGLLALLEKPTRPVARLRFASEGLMVTASVLFAAWGTVLPDAFAATEGRTIEERALLLAHPISDVLLIGVVVFTVTKLRLLGRWSVPLLVGIGAVAFQSSSVREFERVGGGFTLLELANALAFVAVALSAVQYWRSSPGNESEVLPARAQVLLLVAPGLSLLIVVGTTFRQVMGLPVAAELTWITIAVLMFAVLLHVTVVAENHTLSRELKEARDEAIHASVLKSHFLANVSHEIRTPMNAVIGLTGLILDTELEDEQRELAIGVATSAEGLLGLINSLLDFSKIEADKMELEDTELDLTDLIDEVAMIVGDAARKKGVELVAYCEPGMVTERRGDPVRLRQVLLNLANNAVKFTAEGSVTIQAMPSEQGADQVAFLVIDTGIGIPIAEQERLFEPFSQLDESTTRQYGGTGLGLGIVRGLVDLMDGTVEMASEVGVGTVFRVTVPLAVSADQQTERGLAGLVGLRALVVDSNAVNRSVLAHTLHSWGFEVDQAASAEEALHQFIWSAPTDAEYAVAIIEHRLEGMDGLELTRALRAQQATANTVVLMLSSATDLSRQAAREVGVESVLIRPVRTTYLLRRIVDALVNQPAPETSGTGHRKDHAHATGTPR